MMSRKKDRDKKSKSNMAQADTSLEPSSILCATSKELYQLFKSTCISADRYGRIGFSFCSVRWHPDYVKEEWKDGADPLIVSDAYQAPDFFFIRYVCSREDCPKCDKAFPSGHHKLIDQEGKDVYTKEKVFIINYPTAEKD